MSFLTALAVSYIGGHPDLNKQNVIGRLVFKEDEFVFGVPTWAGFGPLKRLFGIPYEKIISVTTDIEKDWSGMRMAAGWLFLGPIGAMLFGKKKQSTLGILVRGSDSDDNPVEVPIAFLMVYGSMMTFDEAKVKLMQRMPKSKNIKI